MASISESLEDFADTEEGIELTVLAVSECFSELNRLDDPTWLAELMLRNELTLDRFNPYVLLVREFDRD